MALHGKHKVGEVMHEFKGGTLSSSAGSKVTNPKQAIAIGLSEAGLAKKKKGTHLGVRRGRVAVTPGTPVKRGAVRKFPTSDGFLTEPISRIPPQPKTKKRIRI